MWPELSPSQSPGTPPSEHTPIENLTDPITPDDAIFLIKSSTTDLGTGELSAWQEHVDFRIKLMKPSPWTPLLPQSKRLLTFNCLKSKVKPPIRVRADLQSGGRNDIYSVSSEDRLVLTLVFSQHSSLVNFSFPETPKLPQRKSSPVADCNLYISFKVPDWNAKEVSPTSLGSSE